MMSHISLRVLVTRTLLLLLPAGAALAQDESTSTTTLTSTTTVLTITTTISSGASVFTSTATETTALVAGSPSQSTGTAMSGAMSYTGDAFQAAVLNSTNYYRAQHQASAVTWDDTLASYAQDYAKKCIWQHSGGPYGENLAAGFESPALGIDGWADEEKDYNYAKAKFGEKTGHFTQLVWKNTTTVGCGAVQCNSGGSNGVKGWNLVCEYNPRGNVVGQFKQEVAKPGESKKDQLGFGAAPSKGAASRFVGALVAAYVLLAICI